ncbi:DUF262 domain-containing protein [Priestia megaterium]|uniref:DUF262 domain-containing protein n=1 Tax=Priestia megaterium TaxID=1404 RepID=UPI00234F064C|nr:DUF262 domain-containing HNH endonuclease family protein [Priestia megaterium]MDC7783203.1 DUF262 domain-containing HNH endonuclease family protein [Priestia megaterium]
MKLLEADTKKLEYLLNLSYGTLHIPYSQRPYEWKSEQVLRLFNDFYSIYRDNDTTSTHILNFITIRLDEDDENKKYIYDGQQRTVTSLLILSALISELRGMDFSAINSANQLTSLYLYTSHWKDASATHLKVVFDNANANFMLHEHIFKGENLPEGHVFSDYDKALFENYYYVKDLIHKRFGDNPKKEDIVAFIDIILERILVIIIETSYENIAEEMFETLNSTGLQIEDFYVLKNALIRTLDEDTVKPIWSSIEINTDRVNKSKFLHAYVNTINGKTPSSDLYNRISKLKNLEDTQIAINFLDELKQTSEIFMKIENPSQRIDGTQEQNNKYLQCINNLALLSANQYKPVILAMGLKEFGISEINSVLEKIISLQLRNIFIADIKANTLEQFYPSLAQSIYSEEITNVEKILSEISDEMINDTQLYEHFNNKIIESRKDEAIIRFILKEIYNSQHHEIVINTNSRDVNLEHILPITPAETSQWLTDFSDEEQRYTLTRRIGNLTVLLNRLNSKIKNSDFSNKKTAYLQSVIPQNQVLGNESEWKKPNIDQRTIDLYNVFKQVWSK